jgi:hypothetical protein
MLSEAEISINTEPNYLKYHHKVYWLTVLLLSGSYPLTGNQIRIGLIAKLQAYVFK